MSSISFSLPPINLGGSIPRDSLSLKEYVLSGDRRFLLTYDSVEGVKGILFCKEESIEFPFRDLLGIPKILQFDPDKLSKFLGDTYIKCNFGPEKRGSVCINQRGRGGVTHNLNFGLGQYTITNVEEYTSNAGDGVFSQQQGGKGHTFYSSRFDCHHDHTHPVVRIYILKRDFFASNINGAVHEITRLTSLSGTKYPEQTQINGLIASLNLLQQQLQFQNQNLVEKKIQINRVTDQLSGIKARIDEQRQRLLSLSARIKDEGAQIRALNEFILKMNTIGTNIITQLPEPIQNFISYDLSQDPDLNTLVGPAIDHSSFLGRLVTDLNEVIAESTKAVDKEIITLIGNTGVGKSTAVNHLIGLRMRRETDGGRTIVLVEEGEEEIAKIGHRLMHSETRCVQVYEKENIPFTFADSGGFSDTRGVNTDIAVMASVKLTFERANSVKLVLCFDASRIDQDRAVHFNETIRLVLGNLLRDYQNHGQSVLLMFTKPFPVQGENLFSAEDAKQILQEMMKELIDGGGDQDLIAIYQFLLREEGRYICVNNPLSDDSREQIRTLLQEMQPIQHPRDAFQLAFSPHTQGQVLDEPKVRF